MSYNPEGESREVENENRTKRHIKKERMSRKDLHIILWISLGVSAVITYLIMFFMGNPFSNVAGKFITGSGLVWIVSAIALWWINATTLFFASKWYMSDVWYLKHWFSYIISAGLIAVLYFLNGAVGLWVFYVVGGLVGAGALLFADYYVLNKVIKGIDKNTVNDDPLYTEEE